MATRIPCKWMENEINEPICKICQGWIVINGEKDCPFEGPGLPKPQYLDLIPADERFASMRVVQEKTKE